MLSATPSLPVFDVPRAVAFYTGVLRFAVPHQEAGMAVLTRDDVELHLWAANRPDVPGGEPHLAGSASCRIQVDDADALHEVCAEAGVVHPNDPIGDRPWGTREFTVLDPDGNAVAFFSRR